MNYVAREIDTQTSRQQSVLVGVHREPQFAQLFLDFFPLAFQLVPVVAKEQEIIQVTDKGLARHPSSQA